MRARRAAPVTVAIRVGRHVRDGTKWMPMEQTPFHAEKTRPALSADVLWTRGMRLAFDSSQRPAWTRTARVTFAEVPRVGEHS